MGSILISRRTLLAAGSAYAVLLATFPGRRSVAADSRVRENIETFATDPQKVAALRAAVKRMQERSDANENDPLGWYYWSAIHWTDEPFPDTFDGLYNQCDHSRFPYVALQFLSWHRAYLFFFEAVLKSAAAEAGISTPLELPYWDWYRSPKMPAIFTEGNKASNPLWHERLNTDLTRSTLLKNSFGFDRMLPDNTVPPFRTFSYVLEANPHGAVHGIINGDMGDPATAARDPIFWLHHANIDRLWSAWMAGGDNRVLPEASSNWGTTSWRFDTGGQWRQTAAVTLNSRNAPLSYHYDDESMPSGVPRLVVAGGGRSIEAKPMQVDLDRLKTLEAGRSSGARAVVSATEAPITLSGEQVTVDLKLAPQDAAAIEIFARSAATADVKSARIVVQDVELAEGADGKPFSYDLVASLPGSGAEPVLLATLNSFTLGTGAHAHHGDQKKESFVFPMDDVLKALGSTTEEALADGLKLTFEPSQPDRGRSDAELLHVGAVKIEVSTLAEE